MQTSDITRRGPEAVAEELAGDWEIDPGHSSLGFTARHMMVTKVHGRFGELTGRFHVSKRPEDSWAEAVIAAKSIDTRQDMRDNHLRSADFLDVERYPEIRFRSTGVRIAGERTLTLDGELTIRDVTRPVSLDVEYQGTIPDMKGGTRAAFSATAQIDREDWGITWNVALEAGGWLVSRKIRLELEIAAVRAAVEAVA